MRGSYSGYCIGMDMQSRQRKDAKQRNGATTKSIALKNSYMTETI